MRSSAPGEDGRETSFAGLHESIVGVRGRDELLDAVRTVWASLWSDAALLYRKELNLDPLTSQMAVLVQEMRADSPSGVAFGRDPRTGDHDRAIVEAVPGMCADLVDGEVGFLPPFKDPATARFIKDGVWVCSEKLETIERTTVMRSTCWPTCGKRPGF